MHVAYHDALVPQLEYDASQFAIFDQGGAYAQLSDVMSRLAISAALKGQIMPISVPFSNATYNFSFYAPAVECVAEDEASLVQYYQQLLHNTTDNVQLNQLNYMAWVPSEEHADTSTMPNYSPNANSSWMESFLNFYSRNRAHIYVFINLGASGFQSKYQLLDCSQKNASYTAKLVFNYPLQPINVSTNLYDDIVADKLPSPCLANATACTVAFQKLMSYQAVMDAFGRVLVGCSTLPFNSSGSPVTKGSLLPLTNVNLNLEQATSTELGPAVEELFRNMTMSLLSSETLQ